MKILLVTPFLPYPLSHGGAVRIYNLCRALSKDVEFTLIGIREKDEYADYPKLHEVFGEVYLVDIDERASKDDRLPAQVRGCQSAAMRALIRDVSRRWRPDILQIEFTHMAAFRDAAPELPALLVEHDLTFTLYRQLAAAQRSAAAEAEYQRWLRFEQHWLRAYEGVWTVSEDDRQTVVRIVGRSGEDTFTVPNGVDIHRYQPAAELAQHPEIFYVGSFRHLPNIIGFENLQKEVMPRVWSRFPEARLRVVAGPRYEQYWGSAGALDPRIEMHGFVEDLRPLYAKCSLVVAPLEVSAGTNIKVLEAMACGKPVVTTPIGCAGLDLVDGVDAVIRAGWAEFAEAACVLLADPGLRAKIAIEARRTAERRFSWNAIAEAALASYRTLANVPALHSISSE